MKDLTRGAPFARTEARVRARIRTETSRKNSEASWRGQFPRAGDGGAAPSPTLPGGFLTQGPAVMPWDSLTTGPPEGVRLKTRLGLIFTAAVWVLGPPRWCDLGRGMNRWLCAQRAHLRMGNGDPAPRWLGA